MKREYGIGLLELMLALVVVMSLLLMATRYFQTTRTSEQVDTALEMINAVYTAATTWSLHDPFKSKDMIGDFVANGSLPESFSTPLANPWGGSIKARREKNDPDALQVQLEQVPLSACIHMQQMYGEKTGAVPSCARKNPTTFSVVFHFMQ